MNIESWVDEFERERNYFDIKTDALESNSVVLMPGRFYVLIYKPNETEKIVNTRPVIISLGLSKKDPESFLCIDLCMIPRRARIRFTQMFFDMFDREISDNIKKFPFADTADKQKEIIEFNYKNLKNIDKLFPVMNAIKRYKIRNTKKIYSIPYSYVYKIIGKFSDENWFINGTVSDVQNEFMKKSRMK